jgi:hypothetical protein
VPETFVGGTGRSGTTVMAKLLDHHSLVGRSKPFELRILTDKGGLIDLVQHTRRKQKRLRLGKKPDEVPAPSMDEFLAKMRDHWYYRKTSDGSMDLGLHKGIDRAGLERALDGFPARFDADPVGSAVQLVHDVLDPSVRERGKTRWVETTPDNTLRAHRTARYFPQAKFIHMIRDGRDVAASVIVQWWGPDDYEEALRWWGYRMRVSHRSLSQVEPERVSVIQLEDLVERDRENTYAGLLDFLDLPADAQMRAFFDEHMNPRRGHVGRWKQGRTEDEIARVETLYAEILAELDELGAPRPH